MSNPLNVPEFKLDEVEVKAMPQVKNNNIKRLVLVISKDIKDEDMNLLKKYFKIAHYNHDLHNNLHPDTFEWDILIIDLRSKDDRYFYLKNVKPIKNHYDIILYCHWFEVDDLKNDDYNNVCLSFPKEQATKDIYQQLLLEERPPKPRWYLSLIKCVVGAWNKVK